MSTFPLDDISPEVCQKFEPFFNSPKDIRDEYDVLRETLQNCSTPLGISEKSLNVLNDDIKYIQSVFNEYNKVPVNHLYFIISCVYNLVRKFENNLRVLKENVKQAKSQIDKSKTIDAVKKNKLLNQLNNLDFLVRVVHEQNLKIIASPPSYCKYNQDAHLCKELVKFMVLGNKIEVNNVLDTLKENYENRRKNSYKTRAFS